MSAPHNSSPSGGPPNAPPNEQPNRSSDTDGPPFPHQDLAPREDDPAAAPQPDDPMPTETSDSDVRSLIQSLADSILELNETGDWVSAFVGRICLRLIDAHSSDKRDVLVSADTAANVELAAFVFEVEGDVFGDIRVPLMNKFRQCMQLSLHAFRQGWFCWTTAPIHELSSEEAARALSDEALSYTTTGWMRALVCVFGYVPELWDLPNPARTPDLGCPGRLPSASRGKGKGVDRSNMLLSDLRSKHSAQPLPDASTTPMNVIQLDAPPPPSSENELQFIFYKGPPPPSTRRGRAPASTTRPAHQPTMSDAPQSTPVVPSQSTPSGQFPIAGQGQGTSAQLPSAGPPPYGPGALSSGAAISGHAGSAIEIGAFDFTTLARELGAIQELRLPDATSSRAFEQATAHLRSAWGGSSHSLPLVSGSSRGNRTADFREQAHRLVQEYKEVKEAQIAKLAEAVQYMRSWHSLYLEVQYRLESRGISVSPEFRAQAARMFVFTNLLTLLVVHRRRQLERLE